MKGRSKDEVRSALGKCIDEANLELQLNVPLAISVAFGTDYSQTH